MSRRFAAAFLVGTVSVFALACSTVPGEDLGSDEAAATPPDITNRFDQAEACARNMKRHESLKAADLDQGLIRWSCGDVPKVTDDDLGQEYCEYHAVQSGRIVKSASSLVSGAAVSCVFTSVFTGAGQAATLRTAMADAANLGVAASQNGIVEMQVDFNARQAATQLLSDCTTASSNTESRLRTAACYQAYAAGGPNAAQLKTLCMGDLSSPAKWRSAQNLGAVVATPGDANYELQRDIAGCIAVERAGVGWRNSDPMICSRVARAASECSCRFGAVPTSVKGLPLAGWLNDALPAGCRFAKVNGADYPYIAICDVSEQEVADLALNTLHSRNVGNFCHDRFAVDLVMKFPLRALQAPSTCQTTATFCSEYMGGDTENDGTEPNPGNGPSRTTGAPAL